MTLAIKRGRFIQEKVDCRIHVAKFDTTNQSVFKNVYWFRWSHTYKRINIYKYITAWYYHFGEMTSIRGLCVIPSDKMKADRSSYLVLATYGLGWSPSGKNIRKTSTSVPFAGRHLVYFLQYPAWWFSHIANMQNLFCENSEIILLCTVSLIMYFYAFLFIDFELKDYLN